MTWELLIACVGLAGAVCAIVFGVINNRRADDTSTKDDATRLARIECKLDNVNTGVQDMRVEVRTHGNQIADLAGRIANCEESIRIAHQRIDTIERGDN